MKVKQMDQYKRMKYTWTLDNTELRGSTYTWIFKNKYVLYYIYNMQLVESMNFCIYGASRTGSPEILRSSVLEATWILRCDRGDITEQWAQDRLPRKRYWDIGTSKREKNGPN